MFIRSKTQDHPSPGGAVWPSRPPPPSVFIIVNPWLTPPLFATPDLSDLLRTNPAQCIPRIQACLGVRIIQKASNNGKSEPSIGAHIANREDGAPPDKVNVYHRVSQTLQQWWQPRSSNTAQGQGRPLSAHETFRLIERFSQLADDCFRTRAEEVDGAYRAPPSVRGIVVKLPGGVEAIKYWVNRIRELRPPGRSFVLQPPQEVWKPIGTNRANRELGISGVNNGPMSESAAHDNHPITQPLPLVLRLPLPIKKQAEQNSHHCTRDQAQINSFLQHGPTIMPNRPPQPSQKNQHKALPNPFVSLVFFCVMFCASPSPSVPICVNPWLITPFPFSL